jgi:hypothetical protein
MVFHHIHIYEKKLRPSRAPIRKVGKHNGFLEYDWRRISCGNGNELFKNLKWITGDRSLIRAIYINFLVETDWCKNKKYQWKRTP